MTAASTVSLLPRPLSHRKNSWPCGRSGGRGALTGVSVLATAPKVRQKLQVGTLPRATRLSLSSRTRIEKIGSQDSFGIEPCLRLLGVLIGCAAVANPYSLRRIFAPLWRSRLPWLGQFSSHGARGPEEVRGRLSTTLQFRDRRCSPELQLLVFNAGPGCPVLIRSCRRKTTQRAAERAAIGIIISHPGGLARR